MPPQIASQLQFNLYLVSLEGYCPDLFVGGRQTTLPSDAHIRWQLAVDTIYRCLISGLIDIWNDAWMASKRINNYFDFAKALAMHNPFDENQFEKIGAVYWLEPLLYATDKCKALITKHQIQNFEEDVVCEPFIDDLESLFEENAVPWTNEPLIAIVSPKHTNHEV